MDRQINAKAAFLESLAKLRREEMAGKHGKPTKQANAANVAMLEGRAAELRAKASA